MNPQAQTQLKTFPVERWKKQLLEYFEAPVSVAKYREKRQTHHWLPPHHQLVQQFGSWPAAMSAIFGEEVSVYRTNWTAEQIQTVVQQAIQDFNRYPSVTEYDQWHRQHPNTPSVRTIERRFGSYGALMAQLGQTDYQESSRKPPDLSVGMNASKIELIEKKKSIKSLIPLDFLILFGYNK